MATHEWNAAAYDALPLPHVAWGRRVLDRMGLEGDERVIDAGCGTGRDGEALLERWPGVRVDRGSSAHVIVRQSGILEELELARHGLRYVDCDPWGFAPAPAPGTPGPDGRPLVFSVDLDATCASIAAACGDADADDIRSLPEHALDDGRRNVALDDVVAHRGGVARTDRQRHLRARRHAVEVLHELGLN